MSYVHKRFEVEKFDMARPAKGAITQEPFVRVSVNGQGCPLVTCKCSPDNYISISDGETGLMVPLTDSQAKAIRKGFLSLGDA
jgi:hypothetical protein